MEPSLPPVAERLHAAFVAAFPEHVAARMRAAGLDPAEFHPGIEEGRAWLDGALHKLLTQPFARQRRSPLELFQEAMRFPTRALRAAAVQPASREAGQRAALPGDDYDLAPASSRDLGEDAWHTHLAWGSAKAESHRRPAVLYVGTDLMDRSKISPVVAAAGAELVQASAAELDPAGRNVLRAFVDLACPDADAAIRALASAGVPTVAFGPHVDDVALVRARALGADDALPRSVFFRRLPGLLPRRV